jgi:hypothetical protein
MMTSSRQSWFSYSSDLYGVKMDSVIRHLRIGGAEVSAKYQIFQCEENYHQSWKLETPKDYHVIGTTLFTYSSLYTYDCFKTFIFREDGFTLELSKAYIVSSFDSNNQIIVDVINQGYVWNETSFTFFGPDWKMTLDVIESNIPVSIQPPSIGNPTELQFDFNGKSDRNLAFHEKGDIESVFFNITIIPMTDKKGQSRTCLDMGEVEFVRLARNGSVEYRRE